tara:strand:- start:592 stop:870 length:279 start_codon:yes stop_codon:yes gene_type:complete
MLEREIERKLTKWAKENKVLSYKFSSPARRGVPDRIFIANGITLFLELKVVGKRPTKLQLRELDRINEAGAVADWAAGYDEAIDKINLYLLL